MSPEDAPVNSNINRDGTMVKSWTFAQPAGARRMRRFISGGGRSTMGSNTNTPNMT